MIENDVIVTTKYGRQPSFAVCPDEHGQFPAIILYMDAPGIREELRDQARRIAKHGYVCLLPDLPRRDEAMSVVIRGAMKSLTNAAVIDDTAGMLAFLDAHEKVKPGPVGCVGHCMSGPFATTAAARFPRIKAAASLYGVEMVTDQPDSPHLLLNQVKGELYLAFAEVDPGVPSNVVPDLKTALAKAGTKHVLETIPGTHHGYCFAARADYHAVAAEETWVKLFDLWDRNLK
ncbi:MAG: dienelactone hydrolase family protein [Betaproteobacteria bacterium]|nr:MAG: dienelactone hydrolase family protein [Betaproteobacteria bacterium]